jgi:hypothetical protein
MGRIQCPEHGLGGLSFVCPHVRQDVLSRSVVRPYRTYRVEAVGSPHYCEACVESRALPAPDAVISMEEFFGEEDAGSRFDAEPVCAQCFKQFSEPGSNG